MSDYEHTMEVLQRRPRDIAKHLREEHGLEPRPVIKGYERSNWSWQHEVAHKEAR